MRLLILIGLLALAGCGGGGDDDVGRISDPGIGTIGFGDNDPCDTFADRCADANDVPETPLACAWPPRAILHELLRMRGGRTGDRPRVQEHPLRALQQGRGTWDRPVGGLNGRISAALPVGQWPDRSRRRGRRPGRC